MGHLTEPQQTLFDLLSQDPFRRAPSWKRSRQEFILEYGWWYDPTPLPSHIEAGPAGECFVNAFNLAQDDPALTYCEGFISDRSGALLIHHAWVTDGNGHAFDNTLKKPATAYVGVPFRIDFLLRYHLQNHAIVCLLDDYTNDWPMLGALGDRPDEWLETKGQSVARYRVQQCQKD